MPVRIIDGPTNNILGIISVVDLVKMKNDFITQTDLTPKMGRTAVVKTHHCFLSRAQVDDLFLPHPEATILKINFCIQLKTTEGCDDDYSDSLTVVIEAALNNLPDRTAFNNVGDFVLIPAYHDEVPDDSDIDSPPCCPSQGGKGG